MSRPQRKAMPRHDPVSRRRRDQSSTADAWLRYRQMMKWMALAAVVAVALSLLYLRASSGPMPPSMS